MLLKVKVIRMRRGGVQRRRRCARTRRRNVWQVHRRKLLAFLVFQIAIENLLPYVFSYFASSCLRLP